MMGVFQALGFMALGAAIVEVFEYKAWRRYKDGKKEAASLYRDARR